MCSGRTGAGIKIPGVRLTGGYELPDLEAGASQRQIPTWRWQGPREKGGKEEENAGAVLGACLQRALGSPPP